MNIPWRLVLALAALVLIAFFAGFNMNQANVSIIFYEFKDVPLFLALIFSYILGCITILPFTMFHKSKKNKIEIKPLIKNEESKSIVKEDAPPVKAVESKEKKVKKISKKGKTIKDV